MGNQNGFDSRKFPEIEDLIREYQRIVRERGEPKRLAVVNEKRMHDMNVASAIVRKFVSESESDLSFNITIDEYDESTGCIEVRGYYWAIKNDEFFSDLQYAEELADDIEFGVSDDGKFIYTLGFKNLLITKRISF